MAATHHGTINTTTSGAQTQVSGSSGVTHSVIKTMTHEEARAQTSHPLIGSSIIVQGSVVSLLNFQITYDPGSTATVVYNYGRSVGSDSNEVQNGNLAYPGRLPSAVTEFFELDASMEQKSILRHPRYLELTEADRQILGAMIQLGVIDADGNARREELSTKARANECADKIESGVTSYLAPKWVWRYRKLNSNWSVDRGLGKISDPYGPAPTINGNWLFTGVTGNGWEGGALEMTATWESSPEGDEWDTDLYQA